MRFFHSSFKVLVYTWTQSTDTALVSHTAAGRQKKVLFQKQILTGFQWICDRKNKNIHYLLRLLCMWSWLFSSSLRVHWGEAERVMTQRQRWQKHFSAHTASVERRTRRTGVFSQGTQNTTIFTYVVHVHVALTNFKSRGSQTGVRIPPGYSVLYLNKKYV